MSAAAWTGYGRIFDDNGWFKIKRNPLSKIGDFPYLGKNIDPSLEPEKTYMVYRPASELSNPETIDVKLLPWVDLHPDNLLGPEEAGRLPAESKGVEGVVGEDIFFEGDTLFGNIKISPIVSPTELTVECEISIGYGCEYEFHLVFSTELMMMLSRKISAAIISRQFPKGEWGRRSSSRSCTFHFRREGHSNGETKETTGETTLDDVNEFMKKHMPKIKAMVDLYEKHTSKGEDMAEVPATEPETQAVPARDKDETPKEKAEDAEEPEKEKRATINWKRRREDDKEAKDGEEEKKRARTKRRRKRRRCLRRQAAPRFGYRYHACGRPRIATRIDQKERRQVVDQEISRRTEVANKISSFTGAFDHSEMTVGGVVPMASVSWG